MLFSFNGVSDNLSGCLPDDGDVEDVTLKVVQRLVKNNVVDVTSPRLDAATARAIRRLKIHMANPLPAVDDDVSCDFQLPYFF